MWTEDNKYVTSLLKINWAAYEALKLHIEAWKELSEWRGYRNDSK